MGTAPQPNAIALEELPAVFLAVEQAGIVALSLADLPPCSFNDGHCIFALHGVQELIVSNHAFQAS